MQRKISLAALTLAAALALGGCSAGTQDQETSPGATGTASPTSGATGSGPGDGSGTAGISAEHNNDDVMFARMMIPHHQQAIEMSEILLAKDSMPAGLGDFAQQVIDAQGPEIDRMEAMLEAWGQGGMGTDDMGDMGNDGSMGHGSGMNGMMGQEDLDALRNAQGAQAARLYLEQMTTHHEGAIEMSQDEVDDGKNPQAVQLARDIITAQRAEIEQMRQMLQELPAN
jgi:uncharacterized protein (DUF305 family)